jgi:nicotinamide riboside kinase
MRIAIVGSSGTGKSTLAEALARDQSLPLSVDPVRLLLQESRYRSHRDLDDDARLSLAERVLDVRLSFEASQESFVADRSVIDSAVFWLYWAGRTPPAHERSMQLLTTCQQAARSYTRVFLLPWGVIPLQDDGVRTQNAVYQKAMHCLLLGVLNDWAVPYTTVPDIVADLDARIAFCRQHLCEPSIRPTS